MASLRSVLLLLGVAAAPAQAGMAAWWNGIGPQIILQNETTNQIRYSACNSFDVPKYSYTDGNVLALSQKPKAGTPLAGVGWWTEKNTIASIFYIDDQNNIINGFFNCSMTTGLFVNQGTWVISKEAPSPHPNSGLAAVVLGVDAGYRVYYHDADGAINELNYTDPDGWAWNAVISHDINSLPGLAAAFSGKNNITVVSPRDEQNMAATRWNKDETWFRSTFPRPLGGNLTTANTNRSDIALNQTVTPTFTLPAWDGKTPSLGLSIDSNYTRSVWYIGNDSNLYTVANQNLTWSAKASQSTAFWPQADKPNAELAVAYDFKSNMVRIYYMVKGKLSEVKYEKNIWQTWSTIDPPPAIAAPSSTAAPEISDNGLSTGAKAGIGVGVSLGAIALGAIIAVIVLARRKKQRGFEQPPYPEEGSTTLGAETPAPSNGSPGPAGAVTPAQYDHYAWEQKNASPQAGTPGAEHQQIHQLDGTTAPTELYAPQPMYELPSQNYSHELVAEPPRSRQ
ncbi:hypothetical protein VTI74DRAFT_6723 [Chaetomium olivicolor]